METPLYVSLPFVFKPSLDTSVYLGTVTGSEWTLHTKRNLKFDSTFLDLQDVKLVRTVCTEKVFVEVTLSQWNKTGLIWHGRKSLIFTEGQRIGIVFPEDFSQRMKKIDVLKGVVKISNASNFDTCSKCGKRTHSKKGNDSIIVTGTKASMQQLSGDLSSLLDVDAPVFPDAVLKCAGVEILVHRCILSSRSPVFADIFRKQKAGNSRVDIHNIKPEVLSKMLMYIYSGKTGDLTDSMASDLLFAADAYKLEVLKRICVDKLASILSVDNILGILILGERLDVGLKEFAKTYICVCSEFSELEKKEEWKSLQINHPSLAMDVLSSLVKYVSESK